MSILLIVVVHQPLMLQWLFILNRLYTDHNNAYLSF